MALDPDAGRLPETYARADLRPRSPGPANLADILERVLDKGIVIAGDIQVNLLDIELLTIKIRLLVASVDRAREMGINWWESDPTLSVEPREEKVQFRAEFERENGRDELEARIERLERMLESGKGGDGKRESAKRATRPASARRATGSRGGNAQKR